MRTFVKKLDIIRLDRQKLGFMDVFLGMGMIERMEEKLKFQEELAHLKRSEEVKHVQIIEIVIESFITQLLYQIRLFIIFRRKIFCERKIFNSVVSVFFLFLKMTRRARVCRAGVLYKTGIRKLKKRIPLSTIFFYVFFDTRKHYLSF